MGKKSRLIARPLQSTPLDECRVFELSCLPQAIYPAIWIVLRCLDKQYQPSVASLLVEYRHVFC